MEVWSLIFSIQATFKQKIIFIITKIFSTNWKNLPYHQNIFKNIFDKVFCLWFVAACATETTKRYSQRYLIDYLTDVLKTKKIAGYVCHLATAIFIVMSQFSIFNKAVSKIPGFLLLIWGAETGDACQSVHLIVKNIIIIFAGSRLKLKV